MTRRKLLKARSINIRKGIVYGKASYGKASYRKASYGKVSYTKMNVVPRSTKNTNDETEN